MSDYIKKYDKQTIKDFLLSLVGLNILCLGIPYVVTLFIKDTYPEIPGMNIIQVSLLIIAILYSVLIITSGIFKEKKNNVFTNLRLKSI